MAKKLIIGGYAPEGAKRRYEAHFISKLTDCDGLRLVAYGSESENGETDSSLDFARDCKYLSFDKHAELTQRCDEIGRMLGAMMLDGRRPDRSTESLLISTVASHAEFICGL